jgi:hypothetical protein
MSVRMYSAQVVSDDVVGDRVLRTSLQRGPHAAVVVCGRCATWLAVGHRTEDAPDVLLRCCSCSAVNDPRTATPVPGRGAVNAAPAGLPPSEVWARSVVEQVHALAEQERRWPWRAG